MLLLHLLWRAPGKLRVTLCGGGMVSGLKATQAPKSFVLEGSPSPSASPHPSSTTLGPPSLPIGQAGRAGTQGLAQPHFPPENAPVSFPKCFGSGHLLLLTFTTTTNPQRRLQALGMKSRWCGPRRGRLLSSLAASSPGSRTSAGCEQERSFGSTYQTGMHPAPGQGNTPTKQKREPLRISPLHPRTP